MKIEIEIKKFGRATEARIDSKQLEELSLEQVKDIVSSAVKTVNGYDTLKGILTDIVLVNDNTAIERLKVGDVNFVVEWD